MNIGGCPYDGCDDGFMLEVPQKTPCFTKLICEDCGKPVWYKFSRINPECWTEEEFLENFEINEASKSITCTNKKMIEEEAAMYKFYAELLKTMGVWCNGSTGRS